MSVAKEQIRQIIADNISSIADVIPSCGMTSQASLRKELIEAELDATSGYKKNQMGNMEPQTNTASTLPRT